MSTHDAEYFRQRRRAIGIPERDQFSDAKFVRQGIELQRLEQLPWPRDLFGEYATVAELVAEASQQSDENIDNACSCGCQRRHNHNVSQVVANPYGRGFNAIYFCSNTCKSKWKKKRLARQTNGP